MDTFSRQFNLLSYDKSGKEIIQDEFANCIFEDSRGLLWIGGRKGVNIYNRKENKVVELNEENGISHPYIRAIAEDKIGRASCRERGCQYV